ncbi:MAG: AI-2E family transporter [Candidatus Hydrothermarchaeales archaeon]
MVQSPDLGKRVFEAVVLISAVIFAFLFLKMLYVFLPALLFALFVAYSSKPLYQTVLDKTKNETFATITSLLVVIIPLLLFSIALISVLIRELSRISIGPLTESLLNQLGEYQQYLGPIEEEFNLRNLTSMLGISNIFKNISGSITFMGESVLQIVLGFIFSFYFLKNGKDLIKSAKKGVPKEYQTNYDKFIKRMDRSLHYIFISILSTAIVTGILSFLIYRIFDVAYPGLLSITTGIVALIPILGTWLIYLPIGLYIIYGGGTKAGVIFIIACFIFISTLPDLIIKPLVSRKVFHPVLMLVAFLGGPIIFGIKGFILGPLIVAVVHEGYMTMKD